MDSHLKIDGITVRSMSTLSGYGMWERLGITQIVNLESSLAILWSNLTGTTLILIGNSSWSVADHKDLWYSHHDGNDIYFYYQPNRTESVKKYIVMNGNDIHHVKQSEILCACYIDNKFTLEFGYVTRKRSLFTRKNSNKWVIKPHSVTGLLGGRPGLFFRL